MVHYDVIVLDIMMPKMDGLEAVRRMRERGTDTPVLFLTAREKMKIDSAGWGLAPTII